MMALHTKLDSVGRKPTKQIYGDEEPFKLSMPPYKFQDLQPSNDPKEFNLEAQYLRSLGPGMDNTQDLVDSYHVLLYEVRLMPIICASSYTDPNTAQLWRCTSMERSGSIRD
jgi:hypothetical protein